MDENPLQDEGVSTLCKAFINAPPDHHGNRSTTALSAYRSPSKPQSSPLHSTSPLPPSQALRSLSLVRCGLTRKCMSSVVFLIRERGTLSHLSLRHNKLRSDGAKVRAREARACIPYHTPDQAKQGRGEAQGVGRGGRGEACKHSRTREILSYSVFCHS